jgi:hypothetical protein
MMRHDDAMPQKYLLTSSRASRGSSSASSIESDLINVHSLKSAVEGLCPTCVETRCDPLPPPDVPHPPRHLSCWALKFGAFGGVFYFGCTCVNVV